MQIKIIVKLKITNMKKLNFLFSILIAMVLIGFTSCDKDDDSSPSKTEYQLVVIKRGDGTIHNVNKTTGELTKIGVLKNEEGDTIKGARALDYNPETKTAYIGSTNTDSASFYKFNYKTGVADMLTTDPDNSTKDGISGVLINSSGNVLVNMYSNDVGNSAIAEFNGATGSEGTHYAFTDGVDEIWSPGGLIFGDTESEVIIGGEGEIYFSNLQGVVSDTTVLAPTANIVEGSLVMDLAKDSNGVIYSLIFVDAGEPLKASTNGIYLAKIDIDTGVVTEIALLSELLYPDIAKVSPDKSNWVHCLAFIPK